MTEESWDIGLVDGDGGNAELSADSPRIRAKPEWCRKVHHIGLKAFKGFPKAWTGDSKFEVSIPRYRDAAGANHGESSKMVGSITGGHDHGVVISGVEMFEQSHHGIRHPVDGGEEALRDDSNSHGSTVKSQL